MADVSRRQILESMVLAAGAMAVRPLGAFAAAGLRPETANMVLGPFYPVAKPTDDDADLTLIRGHRDRAAGQVLHVSGRVLNRHGFPVPNARMEIWQTNMYGRYAHASDPNTSAPLDPNFQGYALLHTDREGWYRFTTIKPAAYPAREGNWMRAPHIHFDVEGQTDRKVTQMFFPNEPLNAQDKLLQTVRGDRNTLIAEIVSSGSELAVQWNVVLATG